MELEFDKEIDAILRKARGGGSVGVMATASPHIDADSIAAFAENALPQKAKLLYMEHFADCDRCRRMLSQTMLLNSEADATAASTVSAPVLDPVIPWYQKLFKTQNLALAMGALVLSFGGILGLVVLQNRQATVNSSLESQPAPQPGGPSFNEESAAATANVAGTQASNSNAATAFATPAGSSAANTQMAAGEPSVNKPAMLGGVRADADSAAGASPDSGLIAMAKERPKDEPAPVAAPPPPAKSAITDTVALGQNERKADDDKKLKSESERREMDSVSRKQSEVTRGRDLPPAASKSGPARSGPLNTTQSNQTQNQNFGDLSVTRSVGGKSFNNRNGVWYDSAYRNQATINHRRGTGEYKKLDGGLRNIADTLGGTVVVVWKEKAYRIQ